MGYCSVTDFEKVLAQTLTTASPNPATLTTPGKLADLGKKLNLTTNTGINGPAVGTFPLEDVNYYIRQAESHIDAALSQQYEIPLIPKVSFRTYLQEDMDEYSETVRLSRASNLVPGDQVVFIQSGMEETVEVLDVSGDVVTFVLHPTGLYTTNDKILVVQFPDPIPFICARLACAMFYDKWARAQSEPMRTEYGDTLRKEAIAELNNIREGRTILDAERIGHGFVNPFIIRRYGVKGFEEQDNTRTDQRN